MTGLLSIGSKIGESQHSSSSGSKNHGDQPEPEVFRCPYGLDDGDYVEDYRSFDIDPVEAEILNVNREEDIDQLKVMMHFKTAQVTCDNIDDLLASAVRLKQKQKQTPGPVSSSKVPVTAELNNNTDNQYRVLPNDVVKRAIERSVFYPHLLIILIHIYPAAMQK